MWAPQRTWYQWVSGSVGDVESRISRFEPGKVQSNQSAIPCTCGAGFHHVREHLLGTSHGFVDERTACARAARRGRADTMQRCTRDCLRQALLTHGALAASHLRGRRELEVEMDLESLQLGD